jgi:hypothetical protein
MQKEESPTFIPSELKVIASSEIDVVEDLLTENTNNTTIDELLIDNETKE